MFKWLKKHPKAEDKLPALSDFESTCPDCGAQSSALHDLFCLKESCPFCDGQLATCDCIYDVLALNDTERKAKEEYVDDSIEPLRSIMDRWKLALNKKGRVPYQPRVLKADPDGLILVSARGYMPFVRKLLAEGVPVDCFNDVKYTPLMAAARSCQVEIVTLLLHLGASVVSRDAYGHTPLHCAVGSPPYSQQRQAACVRLLLERGAVVDALDEGGGTPLMSAAWFGGEDAVRELLRAGAKNSYRDSKGRSSADLALARGHESIAQILAAGS